MFFYIYISIITSLLCYVTCKFYDSNKVVSYIFLVMFILFPSIIEGGRNWDIGIDMLGYGQLYFYEAQSYDSVFDFLPNVDSYEYGYHLLNYIASRIGAINVMMFLAGLIKATLVALTCVHFRKLTIPWLLVFCYMLFFYWMGFSMMRQSIALCFTLYSMAFLFDRKYIGFAVCAILSYLFHSSGIFTLVIPFVVIMSQNKKRLAISVLGVIVIYSMASTIFIFLANSGLFREQMLDAYMNSGVANAKTNIIIMIIYILFSFFYKTKDKFLKSMVLSCSIFGIMTLSLSSLFEVAFRVSLYFMMPLLIFIPALIREDKNQVKQVIGIFILVGIFITHYLISVSHGLDGTYPYKSVILDFII